MICDDQLTQVARTQGIVAQVLPHCLVQLHAKDTLLHNDASGLIMISPKETYFDLARTIQEIQFGLGSHKLFSNLNQVNMKLTQSAAITALGLTFLIGTALPVQGIQAAANDPANAHSNATFPDRFDPRRNAAEDIVNAIARAKAENKRIILDVGGEWCSWCLRMDRFMQNDAQIQSALASHFIWVKINFSEENENRDVLSKYPKIKGYPHLLVLDKDGTLLQSQSTAPLEQEKSYSSERFLKFLKDWTLP
ncbi:MAG TPA: thioredoxin family protein [Burkholderiaceae bacterium]|nr:thioredoxin family protein [Burkholderiaceae bacterium]